MIRQATAIGIVLAFLILLLPSTHGGGGQAQPPVNKTKMCVGHAPATTYRAVLVEYKRTDYSIDRLEEVLLGWANWKRSNIHKLDYRDKEAFSQELKWLADDACANDVSLIYISGHGTNSGDRDPMDEGGTGSDDECVYTTPGDGLNITDDELWAFTEEVFLIPLFLIKGKIVLIVDACHSGGFAGKNDGIGTEAPQDIATCAENDLKNRTLVLQATPSTGKYVFTPGESSPFVRSILPGINHTTKNADKKPNGNEDGSISAEEMARNVSTWTDDEPKLVQSETWDGTTAEDIVLFQECTDKNGFSPADFPRETDVAAACDAGSHELIFNVYDTLISMGEPVAGFDTYESDWAFVPSLSVIVPCRQEVIMTFPETGLNSSDPTGYWFEPTPPDEKWHHIEQWFNDNITDDTVGPNDVLFIGEYTTVGLPIRDAITVRTWNVLEVAGGLVTVHHYYYDFQIRTNPAIYFVDQTGAVVDTFDIDDVEYSFTKACARSLSPTSMLNIPCFDLPSASITLGMGWEWCSVFWAKMIEDAFEIVEPNTFRINVGIPFADVTFKRILTQTLSSIMSKAWCLAWGDFDAADFYLDANANNIMDWYDVNSPSRVRGASAPYNTVQPDHYCGTGPYRVTTADSTIEGGLVILTKNDLYWRGWPSDDQRSCLEYVQIDYVPDWATRKQLFLDGKSDIVDVPEANKYELMDIWREPTDPSIKRIRPPFWRVDGAIIKLPDYPYWGGLVLSHIANEMWLKYWVKGWYFNALYPSLYYYHLYKEDTCWADVDGPIEGVPDAKTDMRDVCCIASHFGAKAPNPALLTPYDPEWAPGSYGNGGCDVVGDRKVDMKDIAFACAHFLHTAQP